MESRKGAAALLLVVMLVMSSSSAEAARSAASSPPGGLCEKQSKDYQGPCVATDCTKVCQHEGFDYGVCNPGCSCVKPC